MTFSFHDIKNIIEDYIDDLIVHSHNRVYQSTDFRLVFKRFHYYRIRLKPHKCIFYVKYGYILGFIVFEHGIMVDPIKVEEILQFHPPHNCRQLQGLHGKANFLHQIIVNYANLTKGFMCLLKKDTLFIWGE
jgi:hypothetical protein